MSVSAAGQGQKPLNTILGLVNVLYWGWSSSLFPVPTREPVLLTSLPTGAESLLLPVTLPAHYSTEECTSDHSLIGQISQFSANVEGPQSSPKLEPTLSLPVKSIHIWFPVQSQVYIGFHHLHLDPFNGHVVSTNASPAHLLGLGGVQLQLVQLPPSTDPPPGSSIPL